jgi:phosphate transport system permease protein
VEVAASELAAPPPGGLRRTRHALDRIGDKLLYGLTAAAAVLGMAIIAAIIWKVAQGAWPAIQQFGLAFIWHASWNPVTNVYGARWFIVGTIVTSFGAMIIAAPLGVAIGLFLSELAPSSIRGPIGSLIEMLAAVPSVVVGLWGILVLGPVMRADVEPFLHRYVGWIPIFGGSPAQSGILVAIVVLAMMALPIISSICRELFLSVPQDVKEAAIGLGATRWEMVRSVIIAHVKGGVLAGIILGLGRALGEAIAVTQVIGNTLGALHLSLFGPGNTLASQIASNYQGAGSNIEVASLVYLGLILLVITFVSNLAAQRIVRRFDSQKTR